MVEKQLGHGGGEPMAHLPQRAAESSQRFTITEPGECNVHANALYRSQLPGFEKFL